MERSRTTHRAPATSAARAAAGRAAPRTWPAEREVADEVPIEASALEARRALHDVPLWFHTFALNGDLDLYTPGKARDHGYRLASIPASFEGLSVLDVGTFDGFYSFLAETRGARRVLAIDSEQYRAWVRGRWGVTLEGGEGFRTIAGLLGSKVEYRKMDAYELPSIEETFDVVFCFGILHRVEDPIGFLRILAGRLAPAGAILVETYGIAGDEGAGAGALRMPGPEEIYEGDDNCLWQFSSGSLRRLGELAGLGEFTTHDTPLVDGHPRIIGEIAAR